MNDITKAAVWARVSTDDQDATNQLHALAQQRDLDVVETYTLSASAWKGEHRNAFKQCLNDAHHGRFKVLIVWAIDRLSREGIEETFRAVRQLREAGVVLISLQEPWLTGNPEVQDLMLAIAAWMAEQESKRRSARTKAGLDRRRAAGLPVGRQPGAKDRKPRKRSGYHRRWENERAAKEAQR